MASNGGKKRWGPSLGVCEKCDKLRKVQFFSARGKWLCTRCAKLVLRDL